MKGIKENFLRAIPATWIVLVASGCGGGGGDEPAPAAPPVQTLVVEPGTLEVQRSIIQQISDRPKLTISVANRDQAQLWVGSAYQADFVDDVNFVPIDYKSGAFELILREASTLAAGTYVGSLSVAVCSDANCNKHIAGSPKTVEVRYTVTRPTGPNAPRFSADRSELEHVRFVADTTGPFPQTKFALTVTNAASKYSFLSTSTNNGVDAIYATNVVNEFGKGDAFVHFKSASNLGAGIYEDHAQLRACYDTNCINELDGSPINVTVRYRVFDTIVDGDGNRFRGVRVDSNTAAWDPVSEQIYLSIPKNSASGANSIRTLDPATASLGQSVSVAGNPTEIASSDDGQFLYVGRKDAAAVDRLRLPGLTLDASIPIPGLGSNGGPFYAKQISVAPGQPRLFAIRKGDINSIGAWREDVVQAWNDTTPLPNMIAGDLAGTQSVESLAWGANASELFGTKIGIGVPAVLHLAVDANGISLVESSPYVDSLVPGELATVYRNGRIYGSGFIYDTQTKASATRYTINSTDYPMLGSLTADASGQNVFAVLTEFPFLGTRIVTVRRFATNTNAEVAKLVLPFEAAFMQIRVLHLGSHGLALQIPRADGGFNQGYVVLVDGPFANP